MPQSSAKRRYLFLQGPHGPFALRLARALAAEGHDVCRINFNGGDRVDWHGLPSVNFTGSTKDWPVFLKNYMKDASVTDIVFYGYWRPMHHAAVAIARETGVRLHGLEEGLLRPNWITLSPLMPHEQADELRQRLEAGGSVSPVLRETPPPCGDNHGWMLFYCFRYYLFYYLSTLTFRRYRSHREEFPLLDMCKWVWLSFFYPWRKREAHGRIVAVLRRKKPFYLLCLQLQGDSQIRRYSSFKDMTQLMELVMESFALNAPAGARLAVKSHPLDNNAKRHEENCMAIAKRLGIAGRVDFIAYGKLAPLLKCARGLVTVNSSAGFSALYHGCPVKNLGQAAYGVPGLVDEKPLAMFWQNPQRPDGALYAALQNTLANTTQAAGGFYAREAIDAAIASCLPRLMDRKAAPMTREYNGGAALSGAALAAK